ncbi:methionine synthase (B12-independent) [Paenibacillus sp. yr247]|uniref:5-methyltetrahydropteroyltriglutamate-- homocysteine S-methyltransferase n=1 Tax=Paenibacillus sp. yr247 TaxID=1761880 RepID=UPI00088AEB35|nr:5-methyltetrahydropteroyltriglutamate--homocysteine S-methyltransferase [Paenibacillus sp. yr247]SDN57955.1 methionine synthase (B12-independent) [Paenibacillus sp. yr247]
MNTILSSNLGFPRIGENREWKKALEAFWAGKLEESDFIKQIEEIRLNNLRLQQQKGIDLIPVGDFSLYDHVLDTSTMFGIVPKRFSYEGGVVPLSTYYAMARGTQGAAACEMTKWFNTNYHYIVPELKEVKPVLTVNKPLEAYREAKQKLGIEGKPVIIGLYTFLKLSKGYKSEQIDDLIHVFLPLYSRILAELSQEGVQWVQMDEPILVQSLSKSDISRIQHIYTTLAAAAPNLKLIVQTYFDSVEHYQDVVALPVHAIGLDFIHGLEQNLSNIQTHGFPANKVLGVGLIDGRNIWQADLEQKLEFLQGLAETVPYDRLLIQPSSSLLHVPVSTHKENKLDPILRDALAFAEQKLTELSILTKALIEGQEFIALELANNQKSLSALNTSSYRNKEVVQQEIAQLNSLPSARTSNFAKRRVIQEEKWQLPFLPTTTIGSFPQTIEVRNARKNWRNGKWSPEQYEQFIQEQIAEWIKLQEDLGLDVLVHGEFERTDMVEFFGEKLDGFAFTSNGWVQSYGSRCVKPPVIFGDVEFIQAMTVKETEYAQTLTDKPVKGMLTGPITILNWSFVRSDITREQVAYQIALALRHEVEALEQAGIEMIQVDEPALREGLPLKKKDWQAYLDWSVRAFRLSTATVRDSTQIHTHMCYCEFHDIIDSIRALDADVISIETSRSHGELIHSFEEHTYDQGIGLGVYDIHSPRVPSVNEMVEMIERALKVLEPELFWINPDCGLKTRGKDETIASLQVMVEAAKLFREKRAKPAS